MGILDGALLVIIERRIQDYVSRDKYREFLRASMLELNLSGMRPQYRIVVKCGVLASPNRC